VTPSGSRYFLLLIDDYSRFMWLRTLHSKDQAGEAIKQFQQIAEAETGCRLRAFCTDRGGEFTSVDFIEYCVEQEGAPAANGSVLTTAKWHRGASKPDGGGNCSLYAQIERIAEVVVGRGRGNGRLSPQSIDVKKC
jgi:hypothetical protein